MRSRALPALAALLVVAPALAQSTRRGAGPNGRTTETIDYVDAWEDGDTGPDKDGLLDVITRVEVSHEPRRATTAYLLLFGPWGQHLYTVDEERVSVDGPSTTFLRTAWKAVDLDGDGRKEIVFLERSITTKLALDEQGVELDQPGPFWVSSTVKAKYLARENGALVEHEIDGDASSGPMKALLQAELGGPLNAWLQLLAADADFARQRYEQARYRIGVVREWAEKSLLPREIETLAPDMPVPALAPDDPIALWQSATQRIGTLPRWYQHR